MLVLGNRWIHVYFVNAPLRPILCIYRPTRRATLNRGTPELTVGINLYFLKEPLTKEELGFLRQAQYPVQFLHQTRKALWTWGLDIDRSNVNIREIVRQLKEDVLMIVKTSKGYHLYLDICEDSPFKVFKKVYRVEKTVGDTGHVRLAKIRLNRGCLAWGVLRIGGKYERHDLEVIEDRIEYATDFRHACWLLNVRRLIESGRLLSVLADVSISSPVTSADAAYGLK